jgi:hypothetical protein
MNSYVFSQKENMSKLSKCLQNQDAPENPEKYQMKAHFLLSSVVYNIVPFYVLFIVLSSISVKCDTYPNLTEHKL